MNSARGTKPAPARRPDEVVALREWCGDKRYVLSVEGHTAGNGEGTTTFSMDKGQWWVHAAPTGPDLVVDGRVCRASVLRPGSIVGTPDARYVAESHQTVSLAGYLARLLGWSQLGRRAVDEALKMILVARDEGSPLLLRADEKVAGIVRGLHERTVGAEAPLVECRAKAYHQRSHGILSGAFVKPAGFRAYMEAHGGTLFLHTQDLPDDIAAVMADLKKQPGHVQVMVAAEHGDVHDQMPLVLRIPRISARKSERNLIVIEYLEESAEELGVERDFWLQSDIDWIEAFAAATHADVQDAARHVAAIATATSLEDAARRLTTDVMSLGKWLERRTQRQEALGRRVPKLECRGRGKT